MKMKILFIFILLSCFACKGKRDANIGNGQKKVDLEMVFDKEKWKMKEGVDYPYRENMLNDVVYNDTVRTLKKDEIIDLLGAPDRINENHLYYTISQTLLGMWPLHKKTMVIKLSEKDSIDWIKIHD